MMVEADLEKPGHKAKHCQKPMPKANQGVISSKVVMLFFMGSF